MKNIPLMLFLGKNLAEYNQQTADVRTLTQQINRQFPPDQLEGHKATCPSNSNPTAPSSLAYHGSYLRTKIIDTEGQIQQARIHRVYCPKCRQTWTVYPSILIPGKHYDSYVVQNTLENTLSHEQSYRAVTRQQSQLTSSGAPKANQFEHARTPWNWVVWLGQFSLPLVLLACGLNPPPYAVEDEKFLKQNRQKSFAVGLVDHRHDLLWWLDYVFATDQHTLQTSFSTLLSFLKLVNPTFYFEGVTGDSWVAAKKAFLALDPRTKLAECLLHPMLKFEKEVTRYIRQEHLPNQVAEVLIEAYWQILLAQTNLLGKAIWPN